MAFLSISGDGPGLLRGKSRQILPPDSTCRPVAAAAIAHKTLNEQTNLTLPSWPGDCTEPTGTSGGATELQVASDPTIHAQSHNPLRHPRPSQADRAPSPFESLLDDSAPAADRTAPPPTDDKAPTARNLYGRRPTLAIARRHLRTTTMSRPSLRMSRRSMRSNRRRARSSVKSARMSKRFTAPRPATTANPRKTPNQLRTRKPTTFYQRHRSRASTQTSRSMRLRQYRRRRRNPTTAMSRNCRNRPPPPRSSQHSLNRLILNS
jgi:hypothetical protein